MHPTVSSYLVYPRITDRRHRWRQLWSRRLQLGVDTLQRITPAHITGFILWAVVCSVIQANLVPNVGAVRETTTTPTTAPAIANPVDVTSATLERARAVTALPGGPTGQLLPPGTMARYGTYFSTYSRGQCTWYVASRRPVPNNWGNAVSWYYHALSSGWRVGSTPAIAAIAWTSAGAYGHVALVEGISANHQQVFISEMNYNGGVGVINQRWAPASSFRYIY